MLPDQVCIVGAGSWGTTLARIVGLNTPSLSEFDDRVILWVYDEMIDGVPLSRVINKTHENPKYLPGFTLSDNVIAVSDLAIAVKDADILIFAVPQQFIKNLSARLCGYIKESATALSTIKGFELDEDGNIELISNVIQRHLLIQCPVMMGANLAQEVASEQLCETTIGCRNIKMSYKLRDLFQASFFRVVFIDDTDCVEICAALKNIIAFGAGIVDGLGVGDSSKAAITRLGIIEMMKFVDIFFPTCRLSTFFESCGIADVIASSYGGRNRLVAELFVKTAKPIKEIEAEVLNGQKIQGPVTAEQVHFMLKKHKMVEEFPLFSVIHYICCGSTEARKIIECICNYPEEIYRPKHLDFS